MKRRHALNLIDFTLQSKKRVYLSLPHPSSFPLFSPTTLPFLCHFLCLFLNLLIIVVVNEDRYYIPPLVCKGMLWPHFQCLTFFILVLLFSFSKLGSIPPSPSSPSSFPPSCPPSSPSSSPPLASVFLFRALLKLHNK